MPKIIRVVTATHKSVLPKSIAPKDVPITALALLAHVNAKLRTVATTVRSVSAPWMVPVIAVVMARAKQVRVFLLLEVKEVGTVGVL